MKTIKSLSVCWFLAFLSGPALAGTVSVNLGWDPVTQDVSGNPLTDLAGYTVYQATHDFKVGSVWISTASAQNDPSITKINVSSSTVLTTISGLTDNTVYYFRLTAFDTQGLVSLFNQDNSGNDTEVIFRLNVWPVPPKNLILK